MNTPPEHAFSLVKLVIEANSFAIRISGSEISALNQSFAASESIGQVIVVWIDTISLLLPRSPNPTCMYPGETKINAALLAAIHDHSNLSTTITYRIRRFSAHLFQISTSRVLLYCIELTYPYISGIVESYISREMQVERPLIYRAHFFPGEFGSLTFPGLRQIDVMVYIPFAKDNFRRLRTWLLSMQIHASVRSVLPRDRKLMIPLILNKWSYSRSLASPESCYRNKTSVKRNPSYHHKLHAFPFWARRNIKSYAYVLVFLFTSVLAANCVLNSWWFYQPWKHLCATVNPYLSSCPGPKDSTSIMAEAAVLWLTTRFVQAIPAINAFYINANGSLDAWLAHCSWCAA